MAELKTGTVYLVGAGPGDPALLTVRAQEVIATADAVLYDRLIPDGALDGAREHAELVYVGKEPGGSVQQRDIGAELVARAKRGQTVVRLKGGDPFVFGRGGEEAEVLRAAGIRYEVVPGITAGIAAPAYAGIPVTHRDAASAVAFVTGHEDPDKPESLLDWEALARFPGTLVFYMGVKALPRIADALTNAGRAPDEPAAVIERGTLPGQRTVLATLATIADATTEATIRPPSITVVGPVAALAERLRWLEDRPLNGRTFGRTIRGPQGSQRRQDGHPRDRSGPYLQASGSATRLRSAWPPNASACRALGHNGPFRAPGGHRGGRQRSMARGSDRDRLLARISAAA